MKSLLNLQNDFLLHICDEKNIDIIKDINHSKVEALARLSIYRNNVFSNFTSVLSSIFATTNKILGTKKFLFLATKYCKEYSSTSGNLDDYGEFFPDLILQNHKNELFYDLAKLELIYHRNHLNHYVAKKFPLKKFKLIKPENLTDLIFEFHPSCSFIASKFSIFSIWKKGKILPSKPEFVLISKPHNLTIIKKLAEAEFFLLKLLKEKVKLYDAYNQVLSKNKKLDVGKIINNNIANGIICGFKYE